MHRPYGAERPRRARPLLFVAAVILVLATPAAGVTMMRSSSQAAAPRPALPASRTVSPVPVPGQSGAAVCTNPQAGVQWRVTWAASGGSATPAGSSAAPAAGSATPAGSSATPAGGSATPAGGFASLRAQAETVQITPTGFSSRAVPGATPVTVAGTPGPAPGQTPGETPASPAATPGRDGWISRNDESWNLRWTPVPSEALSRQTADANQRQGTLGQLAAVPVTAAQSPRFVTPDGSCTVFVTPYMSGQAGGRTAAVLGDSLTAQLYASLDGLGTSEGALQQQLETEGFRPEINGQAGRRWTALPGTVPGITQANADMVDEIRGLREAQSVVVALGVNDAGWVALAPDPQTYRLRISWVLLHLAPVLDELRDRGHCTVLVTMSDGDQSYLGSAEGMYQRAASRINAYLTQRANEDPNDRLRLWDWGSLTDGHHTSDPEPWFSRDTIHLNTDGQIAYAQELAKAAELC